MSRNNWTVWPSNKKVICQLHWLLVNVITEHCGYGEPCRGFGEGKRTTARTGQWHPQQFTGIGRSSGLSYS